MALFISEHYDDARREFETAIALNPNLFEAWYYYGLASSSQGAFEKAASLYTRASEVNPADFQVPLFLAPTYSSLGRKREEMELRLVSLGPIQRHRKPNPHDTRTLYCGSQNPVRVGDPPKATHR